MNFRDIAVDLVQQHGLRDLCEIGVWRGELSRMLAPLARTLVLVDPWSALWNDFMTDRGEKYTCTMGGSMLTQGELNEVHAKIVKEFPQALILRMPSSEAAGHAPDRSLDFIFIDAVHLRYNVLQDLRLWWPKLRKHGVMAGDDYCGPVEQAVDQFLNYPVNRIDNVWWLERKA